MHMTRRTAVPSRSAAHAALIALIALLATALLLAAAAGLRHRIIHAWPAMTVMAAGGIPYLARNPARERPQDQAPVHSCAAYEAATQADHLPPTIHSPPVPPIQAQARFCARPLL